MPWYQKDRISCPFIKKLPDRQAAEFRTCKQSGVALREVSDIDPATVSAIHLDAVGGIAGDMFIAALIDAMPGLWPACARSIAAMSPPAAIEASHVRHSDGVLSGSRFVVRDEGAEQDGHHEHDHHHTHWSDIRERLGRAELGETTRGIAVAIFTRLATAEAAVHAIPVEKVAFHEVGAWDSIIDIVAAAAIIAQLPNCVWSVGALPRGRGLVRTAHGMLPVPAPATVGLLQGFTLVDDGEDGERITPTGAAILNYLDASQSPDKTARRLVDAGTGFGTRKLRQRSNILRATVYCDAVNPLERDVVELLRCEIDDQTAEDLAIALDRIRDCEGVLDVCQWPVFAKKGRMATAVQVLTRPDAATEVIAMILDETTTLGVRRSSVTRDILGREPHAADGVRIKTADRPSGTTAKAEATDVMAIPTHAGRQQARARAERTVLKDGPDGD